MCVYIYAYIYKTYTILSEENDTVQFSIRQVFEDR